MQEKHGPEFWIGNALLGLSLIMLIFLGALWEALGVWAMMLWMILAGRLVHILSGWI